MCAHKATHNKKEKRSLISSSSQHEMTTGGNHDDAQGAQRAYEEAEKHRYNAYLAQHKQLVDLEAEVSKSFDHWILTLSVGALALSITFIEKIAPHPMPWSLPFLVAAWISLLVSTFCLLFSHHTSQKGMMKQREILDKVFKSDIPGEEDRINKYANLTMRLNAHSIWFFIAGISFLCIFSIVNLPFTRIVSMTTIPSTEKTAKSSASQVILKPMGK